MTIKRKLIVINLVLVVVATSVTAAAFIMVERSYLQRMIINELVAHASILSRVSSQALTTGDSRSARRVLSSLDSVPQVVEAYLFDLRHDVVASYRRDSPITSVDEGRPGILHLPDEQARGVVFSNDRIVIVTPVRFEHQRVGVLYLRSSLEHFDEYRSRAIILGLVASVLALAVSLLMLPPMIRVLSDPVARLLGTIQAVRRDRNYRIRVEKMAEDEFGELADAFNAMLEEIGHRDGELLRHRSRLESEVLERTQALKRANRNLEQTVLALQQANRTLRISEENKRVAEASAEAKAQFLANMSHELRTPMNGVLGMLTLLAETRLSEDQRHYVDVAYDSGHILLQLLNNVLDLSKIEQGKLVLESIPFELRSEIDEVISILGESAYAKRLELIVECRPGTPVTVCGDPTRLKQLVFNLVGNAIKFTHQGFVRLGCALISHSASAWRLRFEIEDTGVGISATTVGTIFETFTQADSSTTRRYGGSGLGLTLCREIVHLMGGRIGVNSVEGKGSLFWFEMDVAPFGELPPEEPGLLKGSPVLLLDPSPMSAQAMIDCLRWLDRPCVVVRDVHQLIERIADRGQGEQAIISLDVGVDVVRDVFAQPGIRSVLVWDDIFLLGSIQQRNDLAKHREFAGLRLLIKPLRLRQVRDALESGKRASSSVVALVAGASGHVTRRVLVVDDNETNRMVAVGLLERFGAEVYSAEDGEEAVDRAAREHFDMILMDCQMPVMDGFTATRAIRNREKTSGSYTPIVAMTAFSRSEDREACTLAGMDDFLGKPVKADELRVIMSKWLVGGEHGR